MAIGGSNRVGRGKFVDNNFLSSLINGGFLPDLVTLEQRSNPPEQTNTGSIIYQWTAVNGYINIPARKFDRLPHEDRTLEIIDETKYWTIMLGGYFPKISPAWRIRSTGPRATGDPKIDILNIAGIDTDSQHTYTVLTAKEFQPASELGV